MTSDKVMMAVLAMDVYNRGVVPKVDLGVGDEASPVRFQLGRASNVYLTTDADQIASGFYAGAYNLSGKTVLSYRGTDFNNSGFQALITTGAYNLSLAAWNLAFSRLSGLDAGVIMANRDEFVRTQDDMINAYPIGLGNPLTSQFFDALSTYVSLAKAIDPNYNWMTDSAPSNLVLTGQSLGGGLAGIVSMVTGADATIYENMPFRLAGERFMALMGITGGISPSLILDRLAHSTTIDASAVDGEFLGAARAFMDFFAETDIPGPLGEDTVYPNITGQTSGFEIHGQAMMVMDIFFSETPRSENWYAMAFNTFKHINDADVTGLVGVSSGGLGATGDKLTSMIAYSVIDDGLVASRPFGDVAIRALANDISDIEAVAGRFGSSASILGVPFDAFLDDMSRMAITFAGVMAQDKVIGSSSEKTQGVFSVSGQAISFDFSDEKWGRSISPADVPGFNSLMTHLVSSSYGDDVAEIADGAQHVYGSGGIYGLVDRYTFMLGANTSWYNTVLPGGGGVNFFMGSEEGDTIYGYAGYDYNTYRPTYADEIIVGGDGADYIYGRGGRDILIGGAGNDNITGGIGNEAIFGGDGDDTVNVSVDAYALVYDETGLGATSEHDIWNGGNGTDTLNFSQTYNSTGLILNLSDAERSFFQRAQDGSIVSVVLDSQTALIGTLRGDVSGFERYVGTNSGDVFVGNGGSYFDGGYGNDVFFLEAGDTGLGSDGDDVFYMKIGAEAYGGAGADEYHVEMDLSSGPVSLSLKGLSYGDSVYVETSGRSVLLSQGIPMASYYNPNPAPALVSVSGNDIVVDETVSGYGRVVTYKPDGTALVENYGSGVMYYTYYGHSFMFGPGHSEAMQRAIGSGTFGVEGVMEGLAGLFDASSLSSSYAMSGTVFQGVVGDRLTYPQGAEFGLSTLSKSITIGGHLDASGYLAGPVDANGSAPAHFMIDDSDETRGTFMYGPSGFSNDHYSTAASGETLMSGSGNDYLMAGTGSGAHRLYGGAGSDVLYGRSGNDFLSGGSGNDIIIAGAGNDVIDGGIGMDILSYRDRVSGGTFSVHGTSGTATGVDIGTDSFSGIEILVGTGSNDVFNGGGRGTIMMGGYGNDVFNLSDGAVAHGGYGTDRFYVETGETVFLTGLDYQDQIYVNGKRVVGLSFEYSTEMVNVAADGAYDVLMKMEVKGSHMTESTSTIMGHWDPVLGWKDQKQVISSESSGSESLEIGPGVSKLVVDGATIYLDAFYHGTAGLSFESPTSASAYGTQNGIQPSVGSASTYYGNYAYYHPMADSLHIIQSEFGLI